MSPLDEMFEQLSLQPRFSVLIFPGLCFDMLKNGAAFPRAFKEAVESVAPRLGLKDADAEALASCAEILGSTEAEGQLFALEGRRERLKELLSDAHEKALSFGKMYRALGFLAGVGAVVLIL